MCLCQLGLQGSRLWLDSLRLHGCACGCQLGLQGGQLCPEGFHFWGCSCSRQLSLQGSQLCLLRLADCPLLSQDCLQQSGAVCCTGQQPLLYERQAASQYFPLCRKC